MATKHHEYHKPRATEKPRGGGRGPSKASPQEHRTPSTDDEALDEALDESFPASDPPSQTQPTHVGAKKKQEKKAN